MKTVLITIICLLTINCGHTLIITDQKKNISIKCHENIDTMRLGMGIFTLGGAYLFFPDIFFSEVDTDSRDSNQNQKSIECKTIKKSKENKPMVNEGKAPVDYPMIVF